MMADYMELLKTAEQYIAAEGISFSPARLMRILSGLDHGRYEILRIIPKGKCAVIIQRCKEPENLHYCVQYGGSGKYFSTWEEVKEYYKGRWDDSGLAGLTGGEQSIDSKISDFDSSSEGAKSA